jgi:hypothetical protein
MSSEGRRLGRISNRMNRTGLMKNREIWRVSVSLIQTSNHIQPFSAVFGTPEFVFFEC